MAPGESLRSTDKSPSVETEKTQRYALVSVYDKTDVIPFARILDQLGYRIISTGGTAKTLTEAEIPVVPIEEITGNPECFDGRMKTISFQIESGILFDRRKPSHVQTAEKLGVNSIDLVVCNLYPFEKTISKTNVKLDEAVENIDVGGPTMIRAAAKNFENVLVIVDPDDYEQVGKKLQEDDVSNGLRRQLAAKAFNHLSLYDSQIGRYLGKELFPGELTIPLRKGVTLRYGENPHQNASLYLEPNTNSPLKNLERLAGRELSLVNLTDINAGIESVRIFDPSDDDIAAVVIKHNSPCGIALGDNPAQALSRAIEADPESAFGGVIVLNTPMDLATAKIITSFKDETSSNIDIVAAPEINKEALELLIATRKSMGIYRFGKIPAKTSTKLNIKFVDGGAVLQTLDDVEEGCKNWKTVTNAEPTMHQFIQMQIGWGFISRIRSNSIIIVDKNLPMTKGIGSGQTSRVRAVRIALDQAGKSAEGAILVSDSFFPKGDSVKLAVKHKIGAIVQQGGSINDQASIDEANRAKIPMVFTCRRAFWH